MDLGVLLSVPLDSVAVRAVLATFLGVTLAQVVLRRWLRAPRARAISALAPAAALVVVVLLSGTAPQAPTLMLPVEADAVLPIPVRDGYLHFAPMAAPLLIGAWMAISAGLLARRVGSALLLRTRVHGLLKSSTVPARVTRVVSETAAALDIAAPRIATPPTCPSGAYVSGSRRPVVVLGLDLVARLDEDELEAVIAHELAHIKRRDLMVAGGLGVLRDLAFFIPGSGWASRQIHRERELAADQSAVLATGRPGALASGLLKVVDVPHRTPAAAVALAPSSNVVDRIRILVDDRPRPSTARRNAEFAAVAAITATAVGGALLAPGFLAGTDNDREAVALVWSNGPSASEDIPATEARAFDVYRRSELALATPSSGVYGQHAERRQENRRSTLRACADAGCAQPPTQVSLGIQPSPRVIVDPSAVEAWRAIPVGGVEATDGFQMFWLARHGG